MNRCAECSKEWQQRYAIAARRFDKALNKAMTVTIIAVCMAIVCFVLLILCLVKTQRFIAEIMNEVEYVEEVNIKQDENGTNIAVVGNRNEVKNGTGNNDSKILEKKG